MDATLFLIFPLKIYQFLLSKTQAVSYGYAVDNKNEVRGKLIFLPLYESLTEMDILYISNQVIKAVNL